MSWLCPTVTAVPLGYVCVRSFLHGPGVLAPLVLSLGAEPGENNVLANTGFCKPFWENCWVRMKSFAEVTQFTSSFFYQRKIIAGYLSFHRAKSCVI